MAIYQNKPFPIQQGPDADKIDYNFDTLWAYVRSLEAALADLDVGGPQPHHILSTTHDDSVVATPADGDFLVFDTVAGGWARFPLGSDGQFLVVVAGEPEWTTFTAAMLPSHNLLSTPHADTTPAAAQRGDVIVAQVTTSGGVDTGKYWLDGFRMKAVSSGNDPGDGKYWLDGFRMPELVNATSTSGVTWRRLSRGTANQFLGTSAGGLDTEFRDLPSSSGDCARAYRSTNQAIPWNTPTAISFTNVEFDTANFWVSGAPTRFTAPATGYYLVMGQVTNPNANFGLLYVQVYKNGVMVASSGSAQDNVDPAYGDYDPKQCATLVSCSAGDYIEIMALQVRLAPPPGDVSMIGGTNRLWGAIVRVR